MRSSLSSSSLGSAVVVCCLAFLAIRGLAEMPAHAVAPILQDRSPQPGSPVRTQQGRLELGC